MTIDIVPVALHHAAGYRACLDTVARERRHLAQVEALPLERITGFVRDSVSSDAVQFMAMDGDQVVGWRALCAKPGCATPCVSTAFISTPCR